MRGEESFSTASVEYFCEMSTSLKFLHFTPYISGPIQ